jgi:hypothetical protein
MGSDFFNPDLDQDYIKRVKQLDALITRILPAIKATQERLIAYGLDAKQLFDTPNNLKTLLVGIKTLFKSDFEYFLPTELAEKLINLRIGNYSINELTREVIEDALD